MSYSEAEEALKELKQREPARAATEDTTTIGGVLNERRMKSS